MFCFARCVYTLFSLNLYILCLRRGDTYQTPAMKKTKEDFKMCSLTNNDCSDLAAKLFKSFFSVPAALCLGHPAAVWQ